MSGGQPGKRRKLSGKLKLAMLLAAIAAIGGLAYLNLKKEKSSETFATVLVERGELVDRLAETGVIELVRTVEIKSTIAGEIRQLAVTAGDWVEKGQWLALIEPDPSQSLQLYQKRSAVERGQLNIQELEQEFARRKALYERQILAEKEFEEIATRLRRARQDLRLAELELEILETKANLARDGEPVAAGGRLDDVRVLAPIRGIVIRREVEIGEVVTSGLSAFTGGTSLFELGDPSQMIVRGDIAEVDIARLAVGQQVEIVADAYPDTTYRGQVRWIAPVAQKKPGSPIVTFDAEIDILDREPRLRQGMSCDIDILLERRDDTLYLPAEAMLEVFDESPPNAARRGKRGRFVAYVMRTEADSVSAAPVAADTLAAAQGDEAVKAPLDAFVEVELEIGLETATRVEVLAGLEEGEPVAADPELIRRTQQESSDDSSKARRGETE